MRAKSAIARSSRAANAPRSPARTVRLQLETLEARFAPATFTWIGGKSNDFALFGNWQVDDKKIKTGPGPGDMVVFNNQAKAISALTMNVTVGGFQMLDGFNKPLFLDMGVYSITITGQAVAAGKPCFTVTGGDIIGQLKTSRIDLKPPTAGGNLTGSWTAGTIATNMYLHVGASLDTSR